MMSSKQSEDNSNSVQISQMNKGKQTHATDIIDHDVITRGGLITATTPLNVRKGISYRD